MGLLIDDINKQNDELFEKIQANLAREISFVKN